MRTRLIFIALLGTALLPAAASAECKNFSSSEVRKAVIKKTIMVGMVPGDVKRSWGDPTKIRSAHPGGDEWEYWNPSGDQVVTFGPEGCVTGWYTHRD